jgi:hypothetical protein
LKKGESPFFVFIRNSFGTIFTIHIKSKSTFKRHLINEQAANKARENW